MNEWIAQQENAAAGVIAEVLLHMPKYGVLYDVGANVGVVTRAALDKGFRVNAFEPVPEMREVLRDRCPDATIFPVALGAEFGKRTLYCDEWNHGWNTFVRERRTPGMKAIEVEVWPLDKLEAERMDVLKIDVEGSEADVVAGAAATIQRCKPVIIMELGWGKYHPDWPGQVKMMEWLFSIGYGRVDYDLDGTGDVTLVPDA